MALPLDVTAPLYSALLALKKSTGFAAVYESKDLRRQVISFLKPQTFDGKLALSPREFSGRPGTCVCGRVVILRGPVQREGRATTALEVHLLGGDTADDVLFLYAIMEMGMSDDIAEEFVRAMELGKVYSISGGALMDQRPLNSTSRMSYFLKLTPPIGVNTIIKECTESPWTDVPLHHPFTEIVDLGRFAAEGTRPVDVTQVCVVGVVCYQPGVHECRALPHGRNIVCCAVIKQGQHKIQCSFWRNHAMNLAAFPVGAVVSLMQVLVIPRYETFELFAVEATQVLDCPAALAESIRATTTVGLGD